jgi:hypothetical protein
MLAHWYQLLFANQTPEEQPVIESQGGWVDTDRLNQKTKRRRTEDDVLILLNLA